MVKLAKSFVAHTSIPKRTSQSKRKGSVKFSSMNKHKKRVFKLYARQGDKKCQQLVEKVIV